MTTTYAPQILVFLDRDASTTPSSARTTVLLALWRGATQGQESAEELKHYVETGIRAHWITASSLLAVCMTQSRGARDANPTKIAQTTLCALKTPATQILGSARRLTFVCLTSGASHPLAAYK